MVFPIGAGNPYRTKSGAQSIENASAEIAAAAAHSTDMRFWFVPSPKFPIKGSPMTNLTGGCNASSMCQGGPKDPDNWGCQNECHQDDGNLVHSWTHVRHSPLRFLHILALHTCVYVYYLLEHMLNHSNNLLSIATARPNILTSPHSPHDLFLHAPLRPTRPPRFTSPPLTYR